MRRAFSSLVGLLIVFSAAACGDLPVGASSAPAPMIMGAPAAGSPSRQGSSTTLNGTVSTSGGATTTTYPGALAPAADGATGTSALGPANIAGSLAVPPVGVPAAAAPAVVTPKPAVVVTPKPTATAKPPATPIPAGQLTVTAVSLARKGQTYVISVTITNKSAVTVNALTLAVSWLDGGHARGGEFGVDSPDGWSLIDAGKTYKWTTTIPSTAVGKPVTALVLKSTTVAGDAWFPPAGTAPYTLK